MNKKLPRPETGNNPLFQLPYEVVKWELLKAAIELKIFDLLIKPIYAKDISQKLSLNQKNTEHMLNALTAIGCLVKENNCFKNAPVANNYLVGNQDTCLNDFLIAMNDWLHPIENGGMKDLIINGPDKIQQEPDNDLWASGARRSLNPNRSGRAQCVASEILKLPGSQYIKKILDIGAGSGIIGIAVASVLKDAECILYDRANVIPVAQEVIDEYGMNQTVSTMAGDYSKDPIGNGYDLIIASQTLNFYRDCLPQLFEKLYSALNPGGILFVVSDSLRDGKTSPESMVLTWLPTALQGADLSFEQYEIPDAMITAGFQSTHSRVMNGIGIDVRGETEMIIGRKSK